MNNDVCNDCQKTDCEFRQHGLSNCTIKQKTDILREQCMSGKATKEVMQQEIRDMHYTIKNLRNKNHKLTEELKVALTKKVMNAYKDEVVKKQEAEIIRLKQIIERIEKK